MFKFIVCTFAILLVFTFGACKKAPSSAPETNNLVVVDTTMVNTAPASESVVAPANTTIEEVKTTATLPVVPATKTPEAKKITTSTVASTPVTPAKQVETPAAVAASVTKPPVTAAPKPQETPKPTAQVGAPSAISAKPALSHKLWDDLLRKYVSGAGIVDYAGIKASDKLDDYLEILAANPPASSWSKGKKIAYWINAYNAYTVKLIVKNYPVKSIRDLDGGDPWAKKWIKIGNDMYSLNQIEKEILIKQLGESRVHFAVNCAAVSCPPLLNRAYDEGSLEATLTQQTKAFLNNTAFNKISPKALELSKIFDWYAADFGNDVAGFVRTKTGADIKDKPKVTFIEYNWKLNGK